MLDCSSTTAKIITTMKIYLHVGAGKCASSSIQSYFSFHKANSDFSYACLRVDGSVVSGAEIKNNAEKSATGYDSSINLNEEILSDKFLSAMKTSLGKLAKKHKSILLSNEGWVVSSNIISKLSDVLSDYNIEIIMIIRPPVLWINSAWWQWGNWSNVGEDRFIDKNSNVADTWLESIHNFNKLNFINKVTVLSLNKSILNDFADVLGLKGEHLASDKNKASSQELLSFMTKHRSLREGPHTPKNEFILNRHLKSRTKSNFISNNKNIIDILSSTKDSCLELSTLIANENILESSAWWEESFYDNKLTSRSYELSHSTLSDMLLEAYEVIINRSEPYKANPVNVTSSANDVLVCYLRDEALKVEKNNVELAYELMSRAKKIRPTGPVIIKKLNEYESILNRKNKAKK